MNLKNKVLSLLLLFLCTMGIGCHKSPEEFFKMDKLVQGTAIINTVQYEDAVYAQRWQPFPENLLMCYIPNNIMVHYANLCPVDTVLLKICYNIDFYILLDESRLELGDKYILEEYNNWDGTVVCWDKISTFLSQKKSEMFTKGIHGVALMHRGGKKTVTTLSGSFIVEKYNVETELYTVSYSLHKYDKDNIQLFDIKGKLKARLFKSLY